jgi:hypothetical protein
MSHHADTATTSTQPGRPSVPQKIARGRDTFRRIDGRGRLDAPRHRLATGDQFARCDFTKCIRDQHACVTCAV